MHVQGGKRRRKDELLELSVDTKKRISQSRLLFTGKGCPGDSV